ncbi:MAG: hypothetical protein H7Y10_14485 [Flavobacterium sp.]|nr:hypothetical protein [Flavobacterium sp.]
MTSKYDVKNYVVAYGLLFLMMAGTFFPKEKEMSPLFTDDLKYVWTHHLTKNNIITYCKFKPTFVQKGSCQNDCGY